MCLPTPPFYASKHGETPMAKFERISIGSYTLLKLKKNTSLKLKNKGGTGIAWRNKINKGTAVPF
jgi:hypothetical protein